MTRDAATDRAFEPNDRDNPLSFLEHLDIVGQISPTWRHARREERRVRREQQGTQALCFGPQNQSRVNNRYSTPTCKGRGEGSI